MNFVQPLEYFNNPKDGTFSKIGLCLGSFTQRDTIIGEDSGLFQENLNYTLVAGKGLVAYRYSVNNALRGWHVDTIKDMRKQCRDKYDWIYQRMARVER